MGKKCAGRKIFEGRSTAVVQLTGCCLCDFRIQVTGGMIWKDLPLRAIIVVQSK
jgi:hypothetical protein